MAESNDERIARKKRERAEYLREQAAQEKADKELADRLDSDPEFAEQFDDSFERGLIKMDNEFLNKWADDKGYSGSERAAMIKAAKKAQQAMRGGWLSSADPAEAARIIDSNKGLRELKKKKKGKGCAVVALLMLTVGGGALASLVWGAVEVVSALARQ